MTKRKDQGLRMMRHVLARLTHGNLVRKLANIKFNVFGTKLGNLEFLYNQEREEEKSAIDITTKRLPNPNPNPNSNHNHNSQSI